MAGKIEVGILGATGMVGQHFIRFLQCHPWFEVKWLGASDRSAGKKYREATGWRLDGVMPGSVGELTVGGCKPGNAPHLIFSALDASVATEIERLDAEPAFSPPVIDAYGGRSLHEQSHGESFLALMMHRFGGNGLGIGSDHERVSRAPCLPSRLVTPSYPA